MENPLVPSRWLPLVVVSLLGAGAFLVHARMKQQRFIEGESTLLTETVRTWTPPPAISPTTVEFRGVWYDDDRHPYEVTSLDAVPLDRRDFVRVLPMDPSRARDREVFMVDFTQPQSDGLLPFRVVARERFEADLLTLAHRRARARQDVPMKRRRAGPMTALPPRPVRMARRAAPEGELREAEFDDRATAPPAADATRITLFGASWCGVCRTAAAWMRHHGISFVERNVDNPDARDAMARVCARDGLSCRGVPVIDVRGRAIEGFDPHTLSSMIAR